jgi:hypothetical protein
MPLLSPGQECTGCGKPASVTILVAVSPSEDRVTEVRYYIPNQTYRNETDPQFIELNNMNLRELPFCASCIRTVEDNFRATILYLQDENGLLVKAR